MSPRLRALLIVVLLGISWAQAPRTSINLVWDTSVAYAAPVEFWDFAWDNPVVPVDGVADSPLVP